ncbi:MAG: class I tRNA ligase family protein, partial [Elusimicrobia bacterium]|nr:class I tRNA ligase family protein [Elusimicrobiota bacterium]
KFHPQSWKKPFVDWLENIQDWCISRQIWWGHRIPVWYCKKCSEGGLIYDEKGELSRVSFEHGAKPVVSFEKPSKCPLCQGADLVQDPDVLDTWFSSGLWPFSVFGWPQKTPELKFYYPTSVLATGYEILYLWVARMVMMGVEFTGQLPFSDVYIHGIVRDKHGKKMSKSLGNVTDPLDLIEKYGTDAVRFSLILRAYPGKDIPFSEDSITGPRNFCNKLYNAARFILMNLPENPPTFAAPQNVSELSDRWILDRYNNAITQARSAIADYDIALAAQTLYSFLWDDFCDWYVELAKPRLSSPEKERVLAILIYIMRGTIKALHPFMPFITEELARQFKDGGKEFLIEKSYPSPEPKFADAAAVKEMEIVMGVTCAIRTIRSQFGVSPAARVTAFVTSKNTAATALVKKYENYITLLAKTEKLEISQNIAKPKHAATSVFGDLTAYVLLEGIIDFEKEKERLQKELERQNKEIDVCGARLNDPKFRSNAPEDEVKKVTDRLAQAELKILQINAAVKDLQ